MATKDWETASIRCPLCEASLEAHRIRRLIPVGGTWREMGREHWTVRCANGHVGDGESLQAAVDALRPPR